MQDNQNYHAFLLFTVMNHNVIRNMKYHDILILLRFIRETRAMARNGVSYETVKQTALTLLSRGEAPSVQRVRDTLGTGSNTTIAEHLKIWRENHTKQNVHALPAHMPKEIIPAMESLWQVAIEQAREQLSAIKSKLEVERVNLQVEKAAVEQLTKDYQSQLEKLSDELKGYANENQTLQTALAVAQAQLHHWENELGSLNAQHQSQLSRLLEEKQQQDEKNTTLRQQLDSVGREKQQLMDLHRTQLDHERQLQAQSESRWAKLIDDARQGGLAQEKSFQKEKEALKDRINTLQSENGALQSQHGVAITERKHAQQQYQNVEKQLIALQKKYDALSKACKTQQKSKRKPASSR